MLSNLAALAVSTLLVDAPAAAGDLTVGSPAPKLTVQEWLKGDPLGGFETGQVYVVEFWATWCPPCLDSIPHLTALQKQYGDKVDFVGVSIWEENQKLVDPFVENMGEEMAYRVAIDSVPEDSTGVMSETWMNAAGELYIPTAFVVDGAGKIAWIGDPRRMDDPLAKIVAGKWDLAQAAKARAKAKEREAKRRAITERLQQAMRAEEWDGVVAAIDQLVALDPKAERNFGHVKFQALLSAKSFDQAYAYGAKLVDGIAKDDAMILNLVAWTIVDPHATPERRDLALALRAAERADLLTKGKNPAVLDTLAQVHFDMGHVEQAIAVQAKAVELAKGTPMEKELAERLKEYEEAAGT